MCANCESERNGVVRLCGAKNLKIAQNLYPQMAPNSTTTIQKDSYASQNVYLSVVNKIRTCEAEAIR
jgi:hypothetical protein